MSEPSPPPRPGRWGWWAWRLGLGVYYEDGGGWRMHCRWWHPLTWVLMATVWLWLVWERAREDWREVLDEVFIPRRERAMRRRWRGPVPRPGKVGDRGRPRGAGEGAAKEGMLMRFDALAGRWAVAFAGMVAGLVVLHLLPLGFLDVVLGWAWVWFVAFRHVLEAPAGGVGWLRGAGLGAAGNFAANLAVFIILGAIAAANPGLGFSHPAAGLALGLAGLSQAAGLITAPILGFALGAIGGAAADGRKAHQALLEAVGRRSTDDGGEG